MLLNRPRNVIPEGISAWWRTYYHVHRSDHDRSVPAFGSSRLWRMSLSLPRFRSNLWASHAFVDQTRIDHSLRR